MADYKVISLSVGGSNNRIYKSGDIVNESNFPPGNIPKLISDKFIKLIPEKAKPQEATVVPKSVTKPVIQEATHKTVDPVVAAKPVVEKPVENEITPYTEITAGAIKKILDEKEVDYRVGASKKELYKIYSDLT